jgi:hypothetical protein
VTGHKNLAMVSRYTQQAQPATLAGAAIMRLEKRNANPSGKLANRGIGKCKTTSDVITI